VLQSCAALIILLLVADLELLNVSSKILEEWIPFCPLVASIAAVLVLRQCSENTTQKRRLDREASCNFFSAKQLDFLFLFFFLYRYWSGCRRRRRLWTFLAGRRLWCRHKSSSSRI